MSPISKWRLGKENELKVQRVLVAELTKISQADDMETLIRVLLSDSERLMVAKRVFAFVLIDQGLGNSEIAKRLHFTRATVERLRTRYKHQEELQKPVKEIAQRIKSSEVLGELLKMFLEYAVPAAFGRGPKKGIF